MMRLSFCAVLVLSLLASSARAVDLTWDPANTGNGATIDPGNGTWDLAPGNVVWNNAGVNVPWTDNNTAVFGGTNGTYAVTLGSNIASTAVVAHFLTSGYTLSAAAPQTITSTFSTSTSPGNNLTGATQAKSGLWVGPGVTANLGNNVTYSPNGAAFGVTVGLGAGAVLNVNSGASINKSTAQGLLLSGNGTFNVAGTITRTGPGDTDAIVIGQWSGENTVMNVNSGGLIASASTGAANNNSSVLVANFAGTTSTLNINSGGTVNLTNAGAAAGMKIAQIGGSTGTVNLNSGGTLNTARVVGSAGTSTFNFNGGTLRAVGSNATNFISTLTAANVLAGGAVIDTNGFNVTVAQDLASGAAVDGGLTKNGAGTLTLASFSNSYNGATTVNGGTLEVTGAVPGAVVVNNGGALAGTGSIGGAFTSNAGGTLVASTTGLALNVSGNVNIAGATPFTFDSLPTPGSTYTLFNFGGTVSNVGNLVPTFRGATAVNVGAAVQTTINPFSTRTWGTTSGVWEAAGAALNWVEGDKKFFNGDTVNFNNPAAPSTVTLNGRLLPTAVNVNNTTNSYTFSGTGAITGATTTLTKTGAGTLTLGTTNSYGGGTTINGGRVVISADAGLGDAAGLTTINAGTLQIGASANTTRNFNLGAATSTIEVDPTFTYTTTGTLADDVNPGTLNKAGTGTLVLAGTNNITGGGNVLAGTLTVNGTLGPVGSTSTINVSTGATLLVGTSAGGNITSSNTITGSGAILNNTGAVAIFTGDHSTFTGTVTQNGTTNMQLNSPLAGSASAAYNHLNGEILFAANDDYTVKLGSLSSTAGRTTRGGNTATGTTTLEIGALGTSTSLLGALNNGATKVIALRKVGAGSLTLGAASNFTGGVTVNAGTVLVNAVHTINANPTATAGYTVNSGGTLGGSGTINAANSGMSVVVNAGGVLAPGAATPGGLTMDLGAGSLNVSAVGAGGFKFDLGLPSGSDRVTLTNAASTLNIGTLNFSDFVFTAATGLTNGVYTLFDAASPIVGSLGTASGSFSGGTATLSINNATNDVLLTLSGITVGLPGDFNGDNKVDGTDFLVWQRGGSPNPVSPGDLATWRSNYGAVGPAVPAAGAVPEPAGCLLAVVGGLGLLSTRRVRKSAAR